MGSSHFRWFLVEQFCITEELKELTYFHLVDYPRRRRITQSAVSKFELKFPETETLKLSVRKPLGAKFDVLISVKENP